MYHTTDVQLYVKRNCKSSSEHEHAIRDDFTRSLNILESTAKIYALNKTQNMLKIIHDTIYSIRP